MTGTYFAAPDCLEPIDAARSRHELKAAAEDVKPGVLVLSETEFKLIKSEVSLAYRWCGTRILVNHPYRVSK